MGGSGFGNVISAYDVSSEIANVMTSVTTVKNNQFVTAVNSSANVTNGDVIGNKSDDESGNSLYSFNYINGKHIHSAQLVYPNLQTGINVTAGSAAWSLSSSFTTIIASGVISAPFDIHYIQYSSISATDSFELRLYSGTADAEVEICQDSGVRDGATTASVSQKVQTPIIPAGTRISAKLASSSSATIARIKVKYHLY